MSTLTTLVARAHRGRRHPTPGVPGARSGISSVIAMDDGCALTAPARLCFLVEERYENHVMPGAVVAVVQRSPLHPGADVVETADGWGVLDVNDFPSFGTLPEAAARAATTLTFAPVQEATA